MTTQLETIPVGTTMRRQGTFTDLSGDEFDPVDVIVVARDPDGNTTEYVYPASVSKSAVGVYYADINVDMQGNWIVRWFGFDIDGVWIASNCDVKINACPTEIATPTV